MDSPQWPQVNDIAELTSLNDPEFLAAKTRVRLAYELAPADAALPALHTRMTAEFDRRASAAWGQTAAL
jgi:hypothetical protein